MAKDKPEALIAENRKARYEYFIEERFEAGIALRGWEVKSLRAAGASESYVYVKSGEVFLAWRTRQPRIRLQHVITDPTRTRKLCCTVRDRPALGK